MFEIEKCPHCLTKVVPRDDRTCPSCSAPVDIDPDELYYEDELPSIEVETARDHFEDGHDNLPTYQERFTLHRQHRRIRFYGIIAGAIAYVVLLVVVGIFAEALNLRRIRRPMFLFVAVPAMYVYKETKRALGYNAIIASKQYLRADQ